MDSYPRRSYDRERLRKEATIGVRRASKLGLCTQTIYHNSNKWVFQISMHHDLFSNLQSSHKAPLCKRHAIDGGRGTDYVVGLQSSHRALNFNVSNAFIPFFIFCTSHTDYSLFTRRTLSHILLSSTNFPMVIYWGHQRVRTSHSTYPRG